MAPTPSNVSFISYITNVINLLLQTPPCWSMWPRFSPTRASKRWTSRNLRNGPTQTGKQMRTNTLARSTSLYIPRLQDKNRIPEIPRRRKSTDTHHGTEHRFMCHATEECNLLNLLQSGRFRASTQHSRDAKGFYAQGYVTSGSASHDAWHCCTFCTGDGNLAMIAIRQNKPYLGLCFSQFHVTRCSILCSFCNLNCKFEFKDLCSHH